MSKTVRIPSKLYNALDEKGGAKLVAYYCMVKAYKNGIKYYSFKSKNNKTVTGASLIRSKTNISLNSIKKYNPMIVEMGLAYFEHKGDFVLKGNEKLKKEYNHKLVPIVIGSGLVDTSHKLLSVKLFANFNAQNRMISKKKHRSEILSHADCPRSNKEARYIKRIQKEFGNFTLNDKAVLSNQSYARIKDGTINYKSKGQYWKSVFLRKGILFSNRIYELIKKIPYIEYLSLKKESNYCNLVYVNGFLAIETASSFIPVNLV